MKSINDSDISGLDFNFHDIIKARITIGKRVHLSMLENIFDGYQTFGGFDSPDVLFEIGPFEPDYPDNSFSMDRKYRVSEDYLYFSDSDSRTSWKFEINERKRRIIGKMQYDGGGIDRLIAHYAFPISYGFRSILEAAFSRKGWGAIHGAGIETKSGKGILVIAPGGFGKTTLCMKALSREAKYLGDERVLIGPEGMKSLFILSRLFDWKYRHIGEEWTSGINRYLLFVKMIIDSRYEKKIESTSIKGSHKANASRLSQAFILSIDNVPKPIVESISREEAIDSTLWNSWIESINAFSYMIPSRQNPSMGRAMLAAKMISDNHLIGSHHERLRSILENSFPQDCLRISLPIRNTNIEGVLDMILDQGGD